jgi:hypothetical protein
MCYAASGPGGKHLSFDECRRAIDRLVEVEGRPEVLQLSGGEPTIHPEFLRVLEYAAAQPIDIVMINTNGLRLARDEKFVERLAEFRQRLEIYLQFDSFSDAAYEKLRGERLLETKLRAVEALGKHNLRTILVTTIQPGVNEEELGAIVAFGLARPWITGVSFQPATYSGRHVLPESLEQRITFPDVIARISQQTAGQFREDDFLPLPCAHPNCHSLSYAYRTAGQAVPLTRFIDAKNHLDLLANGITFTRPAARKLIESYLARQGCCSGGCDSAATVARARPAAIATDNGAQRSDGNGSTAIHRLSASSDLDALAQDFFARALAEKLTPADVFRITITSFLDAYNFDVRRLMKCCIHHVLPSGHVIPFCAYNVLYRDGHVPLPALIGRATRNLTP